MSGDIDEGAYDALRLRQWQAGEARGLSRRAFLALAAAASAGAASPGAVLGPGAASADTGSPIVKPLPPQWFTVFGSNAEMRWSAMRGQGYLVPVDRFFVRDHTSTPLIDAAGWRLHLFGAGLRHGPGDATYDAPRRL